MNKPIRSAAFVFIGFVTVAVLGCGQEAVTVDAAPFRTAIEDYLRDGNMALAIKAIKQGPTVERDTAQLSASLTHQELGGASVTWTFHFQQQTDGKWAVVRHEN